MKFWHIGDTHSYHSLLNIPDGIEMVIHSGDFSKHRDVYKNEPEARDFLNWYAALNIKYKILIAGNHDALAYQWNTKFKELCKELNIIYLENTSVTIEGINIWGSPHTPNFGDWYFMKNRSKLDKVWRTIPKNTDIVVTHTPPKGVLDISENRNRDIEFRGCNALKKRMLKLQPKFNLFGHIHNYKDIINAGTMQLTGYDTIFSNGSVVTDNEFGKLSSHGNVLTLIK